MLDVRNLTAGYGGAPVVRDVSFSIPPGGALVLLGRNGSGKTTVLRALLGLLRYDGSVTLGGADLRALPRREHARKVAMLSQLTPSHTSYSVLDTVLMGRYPHRAGALSRPSRLDRDIAERCLADVGLFELRRHGTGTLSGGQLQRVFLARALCQDPELLLLDEPTNHLDLQCRLELLDLLSAWRARGGRLCGATHDVTLAPRFGGEALLLHDGQALLRGATAEVLRSDVLAQRFGVDVAAFLRELGG